MASLDTNSDVFISYKRLNKDFVTKLHDELVGKGREVWVDFEDIPPGGTDFMQEIYEGIDGANTFIVVLTPEYLKSKYTLAELDYAVKNNKKVLPLLYEEVDTAEVPESIQHINWIYFNRDDDFETALGKLISAMDTDLDYLKTHKRLLVRARRWDTNGRDNGLLLSSSEVTEADQWMAASVTKTPHPTVLHTDYISASRAARARRQRQILTGVTATLVISLVTTLIAIVFYFQSQQAQQEEAEAREQAEVNLFEAQNTQSLFLSNLAQQAFEDERPQTALLLAIEALGFREQGIKHTESIAALRLALSSDIQELSYIEHERPITAVDISQDLQKVVTASGQVATIWDVRERELGLELEHEGLVSYVEWSPSAEAVLTINVAQGCISVNCPISLNIWDAETGERTFQYETTGEGASHWNDDGTNLEFFAALQFPELLCTQNCVTQIKVWSIDDTQNAMAQVSSKEAIDAISLSPNGEKVAIFYPQVVQVLDITTGDSDFRITGFNNAMWHGSGQFILAWDDGVCDDDVCQTTFNTYSTRNGELQTEWVVDGIADEVTWYEAGRELLIHTKPATTCEENCTFALEGWRILREDDSFMPVNEFVFPLDSQVVQIEFDARHRRLITVNDSAGAQRRIDVWNVDTQQQILSMPEGESYRLAFWAGGRNTMLTVMQDHSVRLWNLEAQKQGLTILERTYRQEPTWEASGERVLVWDNENLLQIWERRGRDWQAVGEMPHGSDIVNAIWQPDGDWIVSLQEPLDDCGSDDCPYLMNLWDGDSVTQRVELVGRVESVVWSSKGNGGRFVAPVIQTGASCTTFECVSHVEVWDVIERNDGLDWEQRFVIELEDNVTLSEIAWNDRGDYVSLRKTICDDMGTCSYGLVVWDTEAETQLQDLSFDQNPSVLRWGNAANTVFSWMRPSVTCSKNCQNDIQLIDVETGEVIYELSYEALLYNLVLGRQDNLLAAVVPTRSDCDVTSCATEIQLWEVVDGEIDARRLEDSLTYRNPAWSNNGALILARAESGNNVVIWDVASNEQFVTLPHNVGRIEGAVWKDDDLELLTWDNLDVARVWDVRDGEAGIILEHTSNIIDIRWSDDERQILTWIGDEAWIWDVDLDVLYDIARNQAIRPLTEEEKNSAFLRDLDLGGEP